MPLDDCLYALQPTIPHLTRSGLHRCLQRHGISRLPETDREALVLTVWDGLGHRAAGRVAGCSVGAFAMRLHRARRRLDAELERLDAPDGPPARTAAREAT